MCRFLKVYGILKIIYLSYIASIHKAMLVSSGKRSSRTSRPLSLLFCGSDYDYSISSGSGCRGALETHGWIAMATLSCYKRAHCVEFYYSKEHDLALQILTNPGTENQGITQNPSQKNMLHTNCYYKYFPWIRDRQPWGLLCENCRRRKAYQRLGVIERQCGSRIQSIMVSCNVLQQRC